MTDGSLTFGEEKLGGATKRPKYRRVCDHLNTEIQSGRLGPGQALPPEVKLAETLSMSRNTVRQALGKLEEDGVIERVQGRGTFVTTDQQRQARKQLDVFALIAPQLREGFYPSLVAGFERSCSQAHHRMIVGNSANELGQQADLILQMIDQRVGGVAFVPIAANATPLHHVRQLQEHGIPVVYCHRAVSGVAAPCVAWSGEEVGRVAGEAFGDLGHRRVAVLFGYQDDMVRQYLCGLRAGLQSHGAKIDSRCERYYGRELPGPEALDSIRRHLQEMMEGADRPTAIFCGNQIDAEQVYLLAPEIGVRIPQDLSLIHFGGLWRNGPLAERLASVSVNEYELGEVAGRLLSEMRAGVRRLDNDEHVVLPVTLLQGDTLGPAPTK